MVELSDREVKILGLFDSGVVLSVYSVWKLSGYNSYSTVWNIVNLLVVRGLLVGEMCLVGNKAKFMVSKKK